MEWVETTARNVEMAKELALDELGVLAEEAEFEVLEEPRPGLFGRIRGEARVRARIRPAPVRPKQDRRRAKRDGRDAATAERPEPGRERVEPAGQPDSETSRGTRNLRRTAAAERPTDDSASMSDDDRFPTDAPSVDQVRAAAEGFINGLASAFGFEASVSSTVEANEIEVRVDGESLGLLIGPGGRTLLGIQDLARVAAQRRLGDHETRLRIDVAGYRERRRVALERFATDVAEQVRATGVARSLDPMPSADRKVIHDALAALDGVTSRSEGEDPYRRIVVSPG